MAVNVEHTHVVGALIILLYACVASLGVHFAKAARKREDKRIQEKFDLSLRRVNAGLPPLTIEEIYGTK